MPKVCILLEQGEFWENLVSTIAHCVYICIELKMSRPIDSIATTDKCNQIFKQKKTLHIPLYYGLTNDHFLKYET
jgi:hypothetical protein